MSSTVFRLLALAIVALGASAIAEAQAPRGRDAPTHSPARSPTRAPSRSATTVPAYTQHIERRVEALHARLADGAPIEGLRAEAHAIMLEAIAWLPDDQPDALRQAALAARLMAHLAELPPDVRGRLAPFLATNRRTAAAVAFAVDPSVQAPVNVYALLDRLRDRFGARLEEFPTLTAAICVVHDRPFSRGINENRPTAPDPLAIFDFFVRTEHNMLLGIREMPTELLVHVVDVTGTIEELEWIQRRHRGEQAVGRLYFGIRYDHDHARRGTPKRSTQAGWNLATIAEHGGVCADQAYYAMMAGKSIGVPSVYVTGRGHDTGHAWVGFLRAERQQVAFNFDFGRYEQYQGIKGDVIDPQRRRRIPDSFVGILAEMSATPVAARHRSAAFVDAATILHGSARSTGPGSARTTGRGDGRGSGGTDRDRILPTLPPAPTEIDEAHRRATSRAATVGDRLQLTELALRECPGNADGWRLLATAAAEGGLDTAAKRRWAEILDRLCGRRYPEFSLAVLKPMIASVPEIDQQNAMWNALFESFSARRDLAAEVRLEQGRMWEGAENPDNAWLCYEDVILRYVNAGPFVLEALTAGERLIRRHGNDQMVLEMYRRVWAEIRPPARYAQQFVRGSTYYRVGDRYARALELAGVGPEAASVRATLASQGR